MDEYIDTEEIVFESDMDMGEDTVVFIPDPELIENSLQQDKAPPDIGPCRGSGGVVLGF